MKQSIFVELVEKMSKMRKKQLIKNANYSALKVQHF